MRWLWLLVWQKNEIFGRSPFGSEKLWWTFFKYFWHFITVRESRALPKPNFQRIICGIQADTLKQVLCPHGDLITPNICSVVCFGHFWSFSDCLDLLTKERQGSYSLDWTVFKSSISQTRGVNFWFLKVLPTSSWFWPDGWGYFHLGTCVSHCLIWIIRLLSRATENPTSSEMSWIIWGSGSRDVYLLPCRFRAEPWL